MARLTDHRGVSLPLLLTDIIYQSIATADVDPLATAAASRTKNQKAMVDRGFIIRGNAAGAYNLYAITWNAYEQNGKALTIAAGGKADLTPVLLYATGAEWELIPLIKVYAQNDATYPTGCATVNIGIL